MLSLLAPSTPEYLPAAQSTHVLGSEAAIDVENFPAPQSVQAPAPRTVLYLPASQASQLSPVYPAEHTQKELPAGDVMCDGHSLQLSDAAFAANDPASQATHAPEPEAPLYDPAAQAEHPAPDPAEGPEKPATHSQCALPADDDACAAHEAHCTEACDAEYVPAPQFAHADEPEAALYVPGAHAEHDPPDPVYPVHDVLLGQATAWQRLGITYAAIASHKHA